MSSIKPKQKKCKGTTPETKGFGCGVLTFHRVYGLGKMCGCLSKWYQETEVGRLKVLKSIPQAKKKVEIENKKKAVKQKKELKEKVKTLTDYQNELQKEINTIVRLIDKGHPCISSGRPLGKSYDAGHLWSRGAYPSIRYHLFNIFAQSVHDNQYKSGNSLEYINGIEKTFGGDLKDFCLSLKGFGVLKLSVAEIKEKTAICRSIVKWLKLQDREFSLQERIELRKRFNIEIGIYL